MRGKRSKKIVSIALARKKLGPVVTRHTPGSAVIEYAWRDAGGEVNWRVRPWVKARTTAAIADWVEDYVDRVERGYRPEGFDEPPVPFCARVKLNGTVLAEWKSAVMAVRSA